MTLLTRTNLTYYIYRYSLPLILFAASSLAFIFSVKGQQLSEDIRINQIGFYPEAPKIAVVEAAKDTAFYITSPSLRDTLYTGELSRAYTSGISSKTTRIADFSDFKLTGTFVLYIPAIGYSHPFDIQPEVHHDVAKAALKGFYFQRASTVLPPEYGAMWSRPGGHPDDRVVVHPSAATATRPAGILIASPGGWYDAGDYNKYIVNSGITMGTLLAAYEDFHQYFDSLHIGIPESKDSIPDLLNEVLWNLRWMLSMQDPDDGGVYHKLTTSSFAGMQVKPSEAKETRYVVQKSTAASLDFAAVMAQASRVYRKFEHSLPGLSDSCLIAAERAWQWAQAHPEVWYDQSAMNEQHDPDINTGAYGDKDVSDEFIWAAAELYVTTQDESYYKAVEMLPDENIVLPSWRQVRLLGYYTLARFDKKLTVVAQQDIPRIKNLLVTFADTLIEGVGDRAYRTVMGGAEKAFVWGSNAVAANQGIALLQAYRITSDNKYADFALANLDYLLGRNATGYSFVTGYGDKTPLFPHHRLSVSDDVREPIPGLLVGGPNPGQQDNASYSSKVADESYVDDVSSYASNEIAINWNAPLVYLTAAIEALQFEVGYVHTQP